MRNFQDTFETRKQLLINAFSICMAVPLIFRWCENLKIIQGQLFKDARR